MKKNTAGLPALAALVALALAGCATTIRLEAPRTPTLDTTGIHRVAVRPFEAATNASRAAAASLTSQTTSRLQATGIFTLISYATVSAAITGGTGADNFVDAIFSGRITHYDVRSGTRQDPVFNLATGAIELRRVFFREVELSFEYFFERARDGLIIGPVVRRDSASSSHENADRVSSETALVNRIISNQLRTFNNDVAPHVIRITRTFETESDRALRPLMNAAQDQVRSGNYIAARHSYLAIWHDHGSVAAAINASILYEATGDTESAIALMRTVSAATGAPRAAQVLSRLNNELAHQAGVGAFGDQRSAAERVADHAIAEVSRVLPPNARVAIHNNAQASAGLVNDVIDGMIGAFLQRGIPVVERQLIELILAEQNLHADGSVTDRDFISIGNLAGANTIVIVGLSGVGAARRLQVRVLDISTGTVRMQSGTGSEWQL
ncbi:MAG: CsgG/HfaB family protein [Treponema sp.]|nr:CsgG/HfaB family protein [Treponema sp.]